MTDKRMAYTQELDDVAEWFDNCGMGEVLSVDVIASIIRKWRPHLGAPAKKPGEPEVARLVTAARDALRFLDYQVAQGSIIPVLNGPLRAALAPFKEEVESE